MLVFAVRELARARRAGPAAGVADPTDCRTGMRASCSPRSSERRWIERVRARILAEARGNPLALLELPRALSPAELGGGFGLPRELPLQSRIEASFRRRVRAASRRHSAAAAARRGRADRRGGAVVALSGGAGAQRRRARCRGRRRPARAQRPRHVPPSAPAFGDLPGSVGRGPARRTPGARRRPPMPTRIPIVVPGTAPRPRSAPTRTSPTSWSARPAARRRAAGVAAAAALLQRAVALTLDPGRASAARGRSRGSQAAGGGARGGVVACCRRRRTGRRSTSSTRPWCSDSVGRSLWTSDARATRCRCCSMRPGGSKRSIPALRAETYLEAIRAASVAGRLGGGMAAVATAARDAPPRPGGPNAVDLLLDGLAVRFTDGYAASASALKQALVAVRDEGGRADQDVRWPWIARRVAPDLFDDDTWHALATASTPDRARYGRAGGAPARAQPALAGAVLRGRAGRRRRAARRG